MRRALVPVALLVLLSACTAPPPSSSATTAPPSARTAPAATPTALPSPSVSATPIALPSFAQLSAPSASVVWALVAGTRLFRSSDRGDTWQERPVAVGFDGNSEIAFVNDGEGWLATPGSAATQCMFQSVGIAHTIDAGAKWEVLFVAAPPAAADPSGLANGQCKERLTFTDAQHGFLSAWDPNSPPRLFRTTNGGRTWSPSRPLPDPPGFTTVGAGIALRAGSVHAFGTMLLVDASGQVNGRRVSYAFRSVDGGATWDYIATLPQPDGTFIFVSSSRWLQISLPASSKESTDGGVTWHSFASDYSQAAGVAPQIVFGDALVGYATVRGGIQRTVDGGAHWTSLRTPGT